MLGARSLVLLCLVCGACAQLASQRTGDIECPDQDENSTVVPMANPANCSTFYECDNGEAKLIACPQNLFFSSKFQVCTYKKDSDCPNFEDLLSLALDDDIGSFTCPDEPDNTTSTYFPNPKNCSTFYECSNEIPVLMECPKKLYFNAKLCVCTLPKRSGCKQPDDDNDGDFLTSDDQVYEVMSEDEWFDMRQHLEKVYSGKCKKEL